MPSNYISLESFETSPHFANQTPPLQSDPKNLKTREGAVNSFIKKYFLKGTKNKEDLLGLVENNASENLRNVVFLDMQQERNSSLFNSKERSNYNFMLKTVEKNGLLLRHASEELKNNEIFVWAAMQQDPWALEFASEELKSNYAFMLKAVEKNGMLLQYADKKLKNDETIVRAATQQNAWSLDYASKKLKENKNIVLPALQKEGLRFLYILPEELQNDLAIRQVIKEGLTENFGS